MCVDVCRLVSASWKLVGSQMEIWDSVGSQVKICWKSVGQTVGVGTQGNQLEKLLVKNCQLRMSVDNWQLGSVCRKPSVGCALGFQELANRLVTVLAGER
jgi:hypothetical protein